MVSQCLTRNQPGIDELTQFALDRSESDSCYSRKLAQVERIAHMSVENGEQSTAGASEEGPGKNADCTHFGVNRTRNGYTQSRVRGGVARVKKAVAIRAKTSSFDLEAGSQREARTCASR